MQTRISGAVDDGRKGKLSFAQRHKVHKEVKSIRASFVPFVPLCEKQHPTILMTDAPSPVAEKQLDELAIVCKSEPQA